VSKQTALLASENRKGWVCARR